MLRINLILEIMYDQYHCTVSHQIVNVCFVFLLSSIKVFQHLNELDSLMKNLLLHEVCSLSLFVLYCIQNNMFSFAKYTGFSLSFFHDIRAFCTLSKTTQCLTNFKSSSQCSANILNSNYTI